MRLAMSLMGGDVCPALAKAAEQARIPSSCGMFVYKDETSKVPIMAVVGIVFSIPSSFCRKSGVSWTYDWILGTRGLRKLSINKEMRSVDEPLPETMGLPGFPAL